MRIRNDVRTVVGTIGLTVRARCYSQPLLFWTCIIPFLRNADTDDGRRTNDGRREMTTPTYYDTDRDVRISTIACALS